MKNSSVKEWYMRVFSDDDLGNEINDEVTFHDLFYALDNYKCVYETLGVSDSIIRERVFGELAEIMDVEYKYIYDQWLKS